MSMFKDLSGLKFGRLTVLSLASRKNASTWLCRCDCGTERVIRGTNFTSGSTKSCGCLSTETRSKLGSSHRRMTSIPKASEVFSSEYRAWISMRDRCSNPANKSFHNYGGRGIQVCERWQNSFDSFLEDMGPKAEANLSLDRINGSSDYSPENCRWTTNKVQMNNVRYNVKVTIDGETNTVAYWCEFFGIARNTYECRVMKGESPQSAFKRPVRHKRASSAPAA